MANNLAVIVSELQRVAQSHDGFLNARAVLDAARPEGSLLHGYFDWDDTAAAERWRLTQAGNLVRRVRVHLTMVRQDPRQVSVEVVRVEQKPRSVRFAQAPRSVRGVNGGPRLTSEIATDDELAADMVDTLRGELVAVVRRAQDYLDAAAAVGREETTLQSVVSAVAEIINDAWPPPFSGGQDGDGEAAVVATA
jgi:hypothetical protein